MTDPLVRALAPVLRDLAAGEGPSLRLDPTPWQEWPHAASGTLYVADGGGTGVWVDTALSLAEQVAELADQVQELAVEELVAAGRASNWPPCPEHPGNHPLAATVRGNGAVWACPASDTPVCRIGELPTALS